MQKVRAISIQLMVLSLFACSSGGDGDDESAAGAAGVAAAGASGSAAGAAGVSAPVAGMNAAAGTGAAGAMAGAAGMSAGMNAAAGTAAAGTTGGMAGSTAGDMALAGSSGVGAAGSAGVAGAAGDGGANGPKDGDPSAPVVELPDVPCRTEAAISGGAVGGSSINATIAGRELAVDYPCGKHEGAHMTVILNLHGTLISGAPFLYQRNYFSAHRLIYSHNLIVLTPQSVSTASFGAQWGNMDSGEDLPYLNELMNWVYTSFAKFQIRSTWIGGHSWGAYYAEGGGSMPGFVCNEMFMDKFKGVIGMSRLAVPPCAERVAMIGTRGSEEGIALLDQDSVAMQHGCDLPMMGPEMIGNNERFWYAGCDPGYVHEDYNMLGKGHIDAMDAEVVLKIVEAIKSTEL